MFLSQNTLALTLTLVFGACLIGGAAFKAEGANAPAHLSVRTSDLDFSHAPDAQVLLQRIDDAATSVCGGTPDYRRLREVAAFEHCRKAAIWQAVRDAHQPLVTEIADTEPMPMRLAVR
jgi:UrcA family protein